MVRASGGALCNLVIRSRINGAARGRVVDESLLMTLIVTGFTVCPHPIHSLDWMMTGNLLRYCVFNVEECKLAEAKSLIADQFVQLLTNSRIIPIINDSNWTERDWGMWPVSSILKQDVEELQSVEEIELLISHCDGWRDSILIVCQFVNFDGQSSGNYKHVLDD